MDHVVKQGECVLSIAFDKGLSPKSIWDDSRNKDLRDRRPFMGVLMPGDVLVLPDKDGGDALEPSDDVHVFRKINAKALLRLRLQLHGEPISDKKVTIEIDGDANEAITNSMGEVEIAIKPNAQGGSLRLEGDSGSYGLKLGWIDPHGEVSGLQGRLFNLGFDPHGIDDKYGKNTRKAMRRFQGKHTIAETKSPNDETNERLAEEYGC